MNIRLILTKSIQTGPEDYGRVYMTINVDIPLALQNDWQVVGAEWPYTEGKEETNV